MGNDDDGGWDGSRQLAAISFLFLSFTRSGRRLARSHASRCTFAASHCICNLAYVMMMMHGAALDGCGSLWMLVFIERFGPHEWYGMYVIESSEVGYTTDIISPCVVRTRLRQCIRQFIHIWASHMIDPMHLPLNHFRELCLPYTKAHCTLFNIIHIYNTYNRYIVHSKLCAAWCVSYVRVCIVCVYIYIEHSRSMS